MRRGFICILLIAVIILTPLSVHASSGVFYSMNFSCNNSIIMNNGAIVNTNGKVMIPVKVFADAIGANVYLDRNTMTYTLSQGNTEVVLNLSDNTVMVNGKYVRTYESTEVIGQRIYAPATFLATQFGLKAYINYTIYRPVNSGIVLKVESGDTLSKIAESYGTSVAWIKNQNNLSKDTIFIGQDLIIGHHTAQGNSYGAYVKSNATVESGPGFSYTDRGYLKAWTSITVIGKRGDWYYATTPVGTGWLHKSVMWIDQAGVGFIDNSGYFNKLIKYSTEGDSLTYNKYVVKSGDTIWSVASFFGISETDLRNANNLTASHLSIGQTLNIPVYNIGKKNVPSGQYGEVLDWNTQGQYVFPVNKNGVLIDMTTGVRINVRRTTGSAHADTETLTWSDTQALKKAVGGNWTWERKPFILEVDGRRYAVSVAAMPHAGVDGVAYLQNVAGRSGDYGYGPNYDAIPGNGMDGHFDLYFLNGRRHKDGQIDPQHQKTVLFAGGLQ